MPAGLVPSGGSQKESGPCLFQLLMAAHVPWLVTTSLQSALSHCLLVSTQIFPLSLSYKDTCDYICGRSWQALYIQILNIITLQGSFCHIIITNSRNPDVVVFGYRYSAYRKHLGLSVLWSFPDGLFVSPDTAEMCLAPWAAHFSFSELCSHLNQLWP